MREIYDKVTGKEIKEFFEEFGEEGYDLIANYISILNEKVSDYIALLDLLDDPNNPRFNKSTYDNVNSYNSMKLDAIYYSLVLSGLATRPIINLSENENLNWKSSKKALKYFAVKLKNLNLFEVDSYWRYIEENFSLNGKPVTNLLSTRPTEKNFKVADRQLINTILENPIKYVNSHKPKKISKKKFSGNSLIINIE